MLMPLIHVCVHEGSRGLSAEIIFTDEEFEMITCDRIAHNLMGCTADRVRDNPIVIADLD
jgi:hypothetical protein